MVFPMRIVKRLYSEHGRQGLLFAVIGVAATTVHYVVALFFVHIPTSSSALLANLIGYVSAVFVSYFGHAKITFKAEVKLRSLGRFWASSISGFAASQLILYTLINHFDVNAKHALLFAILSIPLLSYIVSKYWVFRDE